MNPLSVYHLYCVQPKLSFLCASPYIHLLYVYWWSFYLLSCLSSICLSIYHAFPFRVVSGRKLVLNMWLSFQGFQHPPRQCVHIERIWLIWATWSGFGLQRVKKRAPVSNPIPLWNPGFPGGSDGKESTCNEWNVGSIPGSGRSLGERNGNPLQHSCLENPMDGGAWRAIVHGVAKSRTRRSS